MTIKVYIIEIADIVDELMSLGLNSDEIEILLTKALIDEGFIISSIDFNKYDLSLPHSLKDMFINKLMKVRFNKSAFHAVVKLKYETNSKLIITEG